MNLYDILKIQYNNYKNEEVIFHSISKWVIF